jgi:hypothetical protein
MEDNKSSISRRSFLQGVKGWSAAVVALALGAGIAPAQAGWVNNRGGGGWLNNRGGGGWLNSRPPGGGWINARGGGGWVNRRGGGGWLNRR